MKKLLLFGLVAVLAAVAVAQTHDGFVIPAGSTYNKAIQAPGAPSVGLWSPVSTVMGFGSAEGGFYCARDLGCVTVGTVGLSDEASIAHVDSTAVTSATITTLGYPAVNPVVVADAAVQYDSPVMPDAGTDNRFDVTAGSGTLSFGILGGTGASVQGTAYPVIMSGITYVRIAEDVAVTRGHHILMSATAGCGTDNAAVSTDGLNLGMALRSEPVTNVILPAGCTGGAGCINTALNTPNTGPAGQITLSADVAAAGWTVGEPVQYWNSGGVVPTGLTDGNTYWLVSVSTTKVQIAATKGGAPIVPSTQGTDATQYLIRLPLVAVTFR